MSRNIRGIAFCMAAAFALAIGVVAATFSVGRADLVIQSGREIERAHSARADAQDAHYRLAATTERAGGLQAYAPVLLRVTDAVDGAELEQLLVQLGSAAHVGHSKAVSNPVETPEDEIPLFDDEMSAEAARAALKTAHDLADTWTTVARRVDATNRYFSTVLDAVDARLAVVQESAPAVSQLLTAAHGSAIQATRDAVATAASAVAGRDGDQLGALVAYADAVDALRASHAAEQARIAAEAVAAAAAKRSDPRPKSGRSDGGFGGGSSPGGGGDGGGDGGSAPIDTRRYVDPRGEYTPGCALGGWLDKHDPGPGGTSIITKTTPYDYRIEGTWVVVYICSW